ncbi:MAG: hypothetical protein Q9220_003288 [cf. Caloplaca sp. 1 TL-2023]
MDAAEKDSGSQDELHHKPSEPGLNETEVERATISVPDGGLSAWIQVFSGHLIMFNIWGTINSFGVWQTYYASTLKRSPSDISWIGSMQVFLLFLVSTFSGRATDAGLFHYTLAIGVQSLFPAALSSLTIDLQKTGVRMGMVFSMVSLFCLTGPSIAGSLIKTDHGRYVHAQVFAGISMLAGSAFLVASRLSKTGPLWRVKI